MWARIEDNRVRELTAEDPAGRFHPSLHWQECDEGVAIGDLWTGEGFAPPPAVPASRLLPALAFRQRFTDAEREAITLAASRGLEQGSARLQLWLDDLAAAGVVDLASPALAERLAALEEADLIAAGRAAEILA